MSTPFNGLFLETADLQLNWLNQDANNDITGDRIKLRDYEGVFVVVIKPAGTGGDDLQLEFQQHTAATSGSSKALNVSRIYHKVGTHASTGVWTYQELATPTGTLLLDDLEDVDLGADTAVAMIAVDIKTHELDGSNGFAWISLNSEGDAIGNALVCSSFYVPYGSKYGGKIPLNPIA